ncbi:MAG TPA: hypothetical protein VH764_17635, partial [Gemmatimonadales bacterium]
CGADSPPIARLELGAPTMDARNEPLSPLGLWILQSQREILLRHTAGGRAGSAADNDIGFPDRRKV